MSTTLTSVYTAKYMPNPSASLNRHLTCALPVGVKEATVFPVYFFPVFLLFFFLLSV